MLTATAQSNAHRAAATASGALERAVVVDGVFQFRSTRHDRIDCQI